MSINKRIHRIESNVLKLPERGSTQFCHWSLPDAEQQLYDEALRIASQIPYEKATEAHKVILHQADKMLSFRVYDLFTGYLENSLCQDDHCARITLQERFIWFMRELAKEIRQELEVSEIERQATEETGLDLVDQYYRKAKPVFTEKSWHDLQEEFSKFIVEKMKQKGEL